jgi:hypothetical protein
MFIPSLLMGLAAGQNSQVGEVKDTSPLDDDSPEEALTHVPVQATRSSGYGWRLHPIKKTRKFHTGLDLSAKTGTPVCAAGSGMVAKAGMTKGYGNLIIIDHGDGLTTRYAHLSKINVKEGNEVEGGQLIGKVGSTGQSTGPHLHFEVRVDGRPKNPAMGDSVSGFAHPPLTNCVIGRHEGEIVGSIAAALATRIAKKRAKRVVSQELDDLLEAANEGGFGAAAQHVFERGQEYAEDPEAEAREVNREARREDRREGRGDRLQRITDRVRGVDSPGRPKC